MNKGNDLRALNILHKAMLAGQILFAVICLYMVYTKAMVSSMQQDMDKILQVIAIALSAAGFYAGSFLFKRRLLQARETSSGLKEKFAIYRSGCIIQWAFLEGPGIFSIACFFLTGNYAFIALAGVLILLVAILAPSKLKIALLLGVSEEEISEL
jgi:hypothetical protein